MNLLDPLRQAEPPRLTIKDVLHMLFQDEIRKGGLDAVHPRIRKYIAERGHELAPTDLEFVEDPKD